jgi:birA, biotin-[acetyl-CoA-carboxylase] ligase region
MFDLIEYDELDSTNNEAKRLVREGNASELHGTVITARRQTAGRGRMGKGFFSPDGNSIYATFILPPPESPEGQLITALAAVAVCEAIEKTTPYKPEIKWVNDVLVDGKKICGILAETIQDSTSQSAVVLGIGVNINLNENDLPDELKDIAGSLRMNEEERVKFFEVFIESVFCCLSCQTDGQGEETLSDVKSLMDSYSKRSILIGKNVFVLRADEKRPATALGIAEDGALIVEYEDGTSEELRTGDVSIRLIK